MGKLFKTEGIVLKFVKYREASIIVKVYTEQFGMKSYIVNSVRSSRGKSNKIALFQPLTLLDLVVYNQDVRDINRLSEVKPLHAYQSIPFEPKKATVAIFLTEVLSKALNSEEAYPELFDFLKSELTTWDRQQAGSENFHLFFLLELCEFLGFGVRSEKDFFTQIENQLEISPLHKELMGKLLSVTSSQKLLLNGRQRSVILELLIAFYHAHLENFDNLKSFLILQELQQ